MARRVISSGKDVQETDQSGGRRSGRSISSEHAEGRSIEGYADRSKAEGFVDARRLQSEDLVSKTLQETTGTIGIMTRPKVVDFGERLKERRQAGARAIVLRVLIGLVVAVVLGAVVWLFLFSSVFRLEPGNISVVGANEWVSESQVLDIARQQSGKSLFLVSDGAVEKQIKAIPGVTSAKSKKQLPNSLQGAETRGHAQNQRGPYDGGRQQGPRAQFRQRRFRGRHSRHRSAERRCEPV